MHPPRTPRTSRKWTAPLLAGLFVVALSPSGQAEPLAVTATATPPGIDIVTSQSGTADGLLFVTPNEYPDMTSPRGPQILDEQGRPVWFRQIEGTWAADLRVQTYQGEPVLTWWEGETIHQGVGRGTGYIANEHYEVIATVQTPDDGQRIDLHEFELTERGTALVISYQEVPHDLTSVGGPADGRVLDAVVQEIDVASGEVLLEWHSLDHIPVWATDHPAPAADAGADGEAFDYLHLNALSVDTDGNLLISARYTSTVYKVDRATGEIIWRLGGRDSDFRLGPGARFVEQHDAQAAGENVYRVFDNGSFGTLPGYESRVAWIEIDPATGTANLLRQLVHPEKMSSIAEGNAQPLPNGNTMVSWGWAGRISEFSPSGELLFDAALPASVSSYRAYRQEWEGEPTSQPEVRVDAETGELHARWNGATEIAEWRVRGGATEDGLRTATTVPWDGLDTRLTLPADQPRYVQVDALDAEGQVLGTSQPTAVS